MTDEIRTTKKPPSLFAIRSFELPSSFDIRASSFLRTASVRQRDKETGKLLFSSLALGRGFLRVDHHAFEGVNRAQHLRVARANLRFFVADFGVAVSRNEKGVLLFSRHWHCNIRRDSVAVDDLLAGGVVLR